MIYYSPVTPDFLLTFLHCSTSFTEKEESLFLRNCFCHWQITAFAILMAVCTANYASLVMSAKVGSNKCHAYGRYLTISVDHMIFFHRQLSNSWRNYYISFNSYQLIKLLTLNLNILLYTTSLTFSAVNFELITYIYTT